MKKSDICRVRVAHGDISGTETGAKVPPPRYFVKRNYSTVKHFNRTECLETRCRPPGPSCRSNR